MINKKDRVNDKKIAQKNKESQEKINNMALKYFKKIGVEMPKNINVEYVRYREPMKRHRAEVYLKYRSIDTGEYFEEIFNPKI